MKEYTEEEIIKKYKELPPDVREAIFGVDSTKTIEEIGTKYKLTIDKVGDLSNEIRVLMIGVTEPKDFMPNISRRLGVDKKTAHDITAEVNDRIFSKIRESLKSIHNIKDEENNEEKEKEALRPKAMEVPMKAPEPPKALSKEDILKEIEEPDSVPIPQATGSLSNVGESPIEAQTQKEETISEIEEEKAIAPPPPTIIEEKVEETIGVKDSLAEEVKIGDAPIVPKPQISRRPPKVSEHDGDKPLGPGGDKYPEGDPYREPVK